MQIAVTGASGFVGRQLVPILHAANIGVLLVGRDTAKLSQLFPSIAACDYEQLGSRAKRFDALVNLAVLNSDSKADALEFRAANVIHLIRLYETARLCGIRHFFDISSVHALDTANHSHYAQSKREGSAALVELPGPTVTTIYLPTLYHQTWSGKMTVLNKIPYRVARRLFSLISIWKPTLDISALALVLMSKPDKESIILTDEQNNDYSIFSFVKRSIDLMSALSVIVFLWWLFAIVWTTVKLTSSGPGIYAQVRVGRHGKHFTCYKFRTMKTGTVEAGTHEISGSAVTSIGAFLRRTKLDELPQVWNILRNEISLVGPRPCLPSQTALISARQRLSVNTLKPGITGLAQINGIDMSDPDRLAEWDNRYRLLQSLSLDLRIILATVMGGGRGDNVSRPVEKGTVQVS